MKTAFGLLLVLAALSTLSCEGGKNEVKLGGAQTTSAPSAPQGAPTPSATAVAVAVPKANTTPGTEFSASPNPIPGAAGAGKGKTMLTWKSTKTTNAEIHVDKPDGPLFCKGGGEGSCTTGEWVLDGQTFFLQNSRASNPTDPTATLASLTVKLQ